MKAPSNQAQPEQFTNLFRHRLDVYNLRDPDDVQDAFNLIAGQAQGVLGLLGIQFNGTDRVSDELMQNAIDAVVFQIDDIKAILNAYFAAIKEEKGVQNGRQ
jgi:hypothetical protein